MRKLLLVLFSTVCFPALADVSNVKCWILLGDLVKVVKYSDVKAANISHFGTRIILQDGTSVDYSPSVQCELITIKGNK